MASSTPATSLKVTILSARADAACSAFSEGHGFIAAALHLTNHKEPKDTDNQQNWEHIEQEPGQNSVRFFVGDGDFIVCEGFFPLGGKFVFIELNDLLFFSPDFERHLKFVHFLCIFGDGDGLNIGRLFVELGDEIVFTQFIGSAVLTGHPGDADEQEDQQDYP